ncbi:MAG: hypothetical protein IH884_02075 [Myxococcales bacterium]|nr:hypothetical protein [Myxococcales bacterium]
MTARQHLFRLTALSLAAVILVATVAIAEDEFETVELIPEDKAGFTATHIFAPITGLFRGGPGFWYDQRRLKIETTPPGAVLDLFYVRKNFQKGYEQADAPVIVLLPSRIEAGDRDSVTIRAFLDGYKQQEISIRVRGNEEDIHLELEPLANTLIAVTHLYFAGRTALTFLTKEALTFRVQHREGGYSIIFVETGTSDEATAALSVINDALLERVRSQQLGEDLVVRIELTPEAITQGVDLRQQQSQDPIRLLHSFTLNVIPPDGGAEAVRRTRAALAKITGGQVSSCATRYDGVLHEQIEHSVLARALSPKGSFVDPYLRAAMKRLGEISPGGQVVLGDGTRFRTSIPLELAAAWSQAAEVRGYLVILRQLVDELEPAADQRNTLRGLIAPEVTPADFDAIVDRAEAAERLCLASAG